MHGRRGVGETITAALERGDFASVASAVPGGLVDAFAA